MFQLSSALGHGETHLSAGEAPSRDQEMAPCNLMNSHVPQDYSLVIKIHLFCFLVLQRSHVKL